MRPSNSTMGPKWKSSGSSEDETPPMSTIPDPETLKNSFFKQKVNPGFIQNQPMFNNSTGFRPPSNTYHNANTPNPNNVSNFDNARPQRGDGNYNNNSNHRYSNHHGNHRYNPRYSAPQYNQNQYNQNQYNQNQYNQTQYNQNQYNQTQYNQTQYDQNQYNRTKYNHTKMPWQAEQPKDGYNNSENEPKILYLNDMNKTNASMMNNGVPNDAFSDKNVSYSPYLGLVFNEVKSSDEIDINKIRVERCLPDERSIKYASLTPEFKNVLNEEFNIHLSSIEYGSVFPFGSTFIKLLNLTFAPTPNYSHEEIRLAYYIAREYPDMMNDYKRIMNNCLLDSSRGLENMKSCNLETLIASFEKMYWPKPCDEINVILSRYTDKINNNKLIVEHIVEDTHFVTSNQSLDYVNPWHNSPSFTFPIDQKVEINSPYLEKPKPTDFPTIANKMPSFYPLDLLIHKDTGPQFLNPNSRSSKFDGAYSYDEDVSSNKSYSFPAFDNSTLPLYPPSRSMCI